MTTTWNPADVSTRVSLSDTNHIATTIAGSGNEGGRATTSKSSGKWYLEYSAITSTGNERCGFGPASESITSNSVPQHGIDLGGTVNVPGSGTWSPFGGGVAGHVVGFAIDIGALRSYIRYDNGAWGGTGGLTADPVAGTGGFDLTGLTLPTFPKFFLQFNPGTITINCGDRAFAHAPPTGFTAWDNIPPLPPRVSVLLIG